MTKTITLEVTFPSVKEAEQAQATALAMQNNFEPGTPQHKLWESIYAELYLVYESMWEAQTFGGTCGCCGTKHGAERDCRTSDLDDCSPGYARSDRYQL